MVKTVKKSGGVVFTINNDKLDVQRLLAELQETLKALAVDRKITIEVKV
jgi:hypothetical protein